MTDHIIFDGKRAVGVEWLEGESTIPSKATANKEVLLCAGRLPLRRSFNVPAWATLNS